jgi:hypothetical protein
MTSCWNTRQSNRSPIWHKDDDPLGSPFACGEGDLPLPNPFKGAILTSTPET